MFSWIKDSFNKVKDLNKSIDTYQRDTVIQSLPTLTYVNRAKKFIEKNQFVEAEGLLLKALEFPQKDALVYKYLGLVYEKTGNFTLAIEHYNNSADLNPNDKNIWQRLGFSLVSAGEYEKACKAFENANKIQQGNTDTFTGWGMALTKLGDYEHAYEKFNTAIDINKYNFSALFLTAVTEIKLGILNKAEDKLSFLSNIAPNEANTFEYARLKYLKDNIDDAIHYAQKSLSINPNMLPAYVLLGQLYAKKQDRDKAIKCFEAAYEKGMNREELYINWAKTLISFENYREAKEKLLKAEKTLNNSMEDRAHLAFCDIMLDNIEESEKIIEEIEHTDLKSGIIFLIKGILQYKKNNINEAEKLLKMSDECSIRDFYIAKCYEYKNDDSKTREYYESATNLNEYSSIIPVDYAKYLISKEDYVEAQRKLRKALKYNSENISLLNLMFYVSYILVKDNFSEYNVKEALSIANKIEIKNTDLFEYPRQKQELTEILSERE